MRDAATGRRRLRRKPENEQEKEPAAHICFGNGPDTLQPEPAGGQGGYKSIGEVIDMLTRDHMLALQKEKKMKAKDRKVNR